jgi:hypothetical protein
MDKRTGKKKKADKKPSIKETSIPGLKTPPTPIKK